MVFNSDELSDMLPIYYKKLFPYKLVMRWLSYGKGKSYFAKREFSFCLSGDVYLRYKSFEDQHEMEKEIQKACPEKIDIGAVFNQCPKKHKGLLGFEAVERELIFDIDLTDYDDVRTCCSGGSMCKLCWQFMIVAIKILDIALKDDFGFDHRLWLYSGRRGVHCWVCDASARSLSTAARTAIAEYLTLLTGGEGQDKKVLLPADEDSCHPSIQRASVIIRRNFQLIAEQQRWFEDSEHWSNVLKLFSESRVADQLNRDFANNMDEAVQRIKAFLLVSLKYNEKNLEKEINEIMLQLCYPRLDANVTKGINHLLKSPFCVHPKTGNISIPIDISDLDNFDPNSIPRIDVLCDELKQIEPKLENDTSTSRRCLDYKRTSLATYLEFFENFLSKIEVADTKNMLTVKQEATDF